MAMISVNGTAIKTPSSFSWGLQDVSDSASGRTQDTIMHKNRVGQKRKIALGWNNPTKEEAAAILQAFNPEYINVTYPDAMSGTDEELIREINSIEDELLIQYLFKYIKKLKARW